MEREIYFWQSFYFWFCLIGVSTALLVPHFIHNGQSKTPETYAAIRSKFQECVTDNAALQKRLWALENK